MHSLIDAVHLRPARAGHRFDLGVNLAPSHLEDRMNWKTPKIVEVQVGMEINMYACASRK
jgi:coenzyme PQQ precursor peptide PqqA